MKQAKRKVLVSIRAVEARVRRAALKDDLILRKCREDSRWYSNLGDYYLVKFDNHIHDTKCRIEDLARDFGVLKEWETIETTGN